MELEKIVEIAFVEYAFIDHRYMEEWELTTNLSAQSFIYGNGDGFIESAASQPSTCTPCDTASDDVSILAFTSGSTGIPKATMHFHRDILAIADTFSAEILKPTSDDLFAGTVSSGDNL